MSDFTVELVACYDAKVKILTINQSNFWLNLMCDTDVGLFFK